MLTLENVLSVVNLVNQLCYVAMFNNMSHVLKALQGYNSPEVYHFDILLLKGINWWKETNPLSEDGIGLDWVSNIWGGGLSYYHIGYNGSYVQRISTLVCSGVSRCKSGGGNNRMNEYERTEKNRSL